MEVDIILTGDAVTMLQTLPDQSVNCCVTSPPYWGLRDYGVGGQIGLEETPEAYVERLVNVFREVKRVLRDDGTLWLNLGDSYAGIRGNNSSKPGYDNKSAGDRANFTYGYNKVVSGLKSKDLVGIPWRVAFALQADGWYLRSDIVWHKPNAMPESVKDRPTKAHEYIFLLSKSQKYYYDAEAVKEPSARPGDVQTFGANKGRAYTPDESDPNFRNGHEQWGRTITVGDTRNRRTVWSVSTKPFKGAHFAVFPPDLVKPCILAGCPDGGVVLDPFIGRGHHSCRGTRDKPPLRRYRVKPILRRNRRETIGGINDAGLTANTASTYQTEYSVN